jgi:6-phosphofructokinase 1
MDQINNIAVLTSGGDAPGMNAAIRAIVRTAIYHERRVFGIMRGYQGMIDNDIQEMHSASVSNIIQTGGTILKTARCRAFMDYAGRKKAYENLKQKGIDALIVIGGDGTFSGAAEFSREFKIPVMAIPATIDNDIYGTDYTIGYNTALNTIVEAVDKIRDTATAHNRLFFIEVMGRSVGFLALSGGVASGAEVTMLPEISTDMEKLEHFLSSTYKKSKTSSIVLVAEGDEAGGAFKVAEHVSKKYPEYDVRVTILGHLQRGGAPSALDRIIASRLGAYAIIALLEGRCADMLGIMNDQICYTSLEEAISLKKELSPQLLELMDVLSI